MRYVVYGIGAVGGTIAACLARAGRDVVGIARGPHLDAVVAAGGLRLDHPDGSELVPLGAVGSPSDVEWRGDEVAVLATKTQDTPSALRALAAAAPPGITVVCAQNGVENERLALRAFARVQAMCVMLPASHLEPGVVAAHSAPTPGILDLGRYPAGTDAVTDGVARDLREAGFSSEPQPAIMRWKYAKLLMNLGNAADAACGAAARGSDVVREARREGAACFRAAGIEYASEAEDGERRGDLLRIRPVAGEGGARGGGSSWQSLARGTGTIEADHLNGEVVLLGRLHDVPTPVNEALQRVANELASARAAPGSMTIDELQERVRQPAP